MNSEREKAPKMTVEVLPTQRAGGAGQDYTAVVSIPSIALSLRAGRYSRPSAERVAVKLREWIAALALPTRESSDQVIPGSYECGECGLVVQSAVFSAKTGEHAPMDEDEECPNGCGTMGRLTYKKAFHELLEREDAALPTPPSEAAEGFLPPPDPDNIDPFPTPPPEPTYRAVRGILHECAAKWREVQRDNERNTNGAPGASYMPWEQYVDRIREVLLGDPRTARACVYVPSHWLDTLNEHPANIIGMTLQPDDEEDWVRIEVRALLSATAADTERTDGE